VKKVPSSRRTSVCLLSTHPLVLSELQRLLAGAGFDLQPKQLTALSLFEPGFTLSPAQVYLIDMAGPSGRWEDLVASILDQRPGAYLLALSEEFDEATAFTLLRLSVKGLLTYDAAHMQLPRALKQVASGGYWISRNLLHRFTESVLKSGWRGTTTGRRLSGRERQVLDGLLENLSNKEIAAQLNISERTVKFHVSNLLSKFRVQRRADLILLRYQGSALLPDRSS
jgi:DNA-binding NarL/FixJ family response regulator